MDIWQTASPDHPAGTGWIGRWLDANGRDPLSAVSLEPVLPPMLAGATHGGAALPLRGLACRAGPLGDGVHGARQAVRGGVAAAGLRGRARSPTCTARSDTFGKDVDAKAKTTGKQGALAAQLDVVARCVEAGAPARVYSVSLGGFDTHADERGTQQRLLTEVDQAVSGFLTRMAGTERGRGVVVMAYSEFGRRVAANANEGTDHGTAGPVFVAGAPVRAGSCGEQPSLTDLDQGDLKATTDFRDVYATDAVRRACTPTRRRCSGPGAPHCRCWRALSARGTARRAAGRSPTTARWGPPRPARRRRRRPSGCPPRLIRLTTIRMNGRPTRSPPIQNMPAPSVLVDPRVEPGRLGRVPGGRDERAEPEHDAQHRVADHLDDRDRERDRGASRRAAWGPAGTATSSRRTR